MVYRVQVGVVAGDLLGVSLFPVQPAGDFGPVVVETGFQAGLRLQILCVA